MFEITLSRGYNESNLREDLRTLYFKLGIENKKIVFLFTDGHVAEEGFLELINNMLTSGSIPPPFPLLPRPPSQSVQLTVCLILNNDKGNGFKGIVPALFPDDEKESIVNQLREEASKNGAGPSKDSVWQHYVNKSANNLHIVLGMSPVGETLRTRCRNFPGKIHNQLTE